MEAIKETNYVPYYVGGGIGVLVIVAGAFFALKKRKNNQEIIHEKKTIPTIYTTISQYSGSYGLFVTK